MVPHNDMGGYATFEYGPGTSASADEGMEYSSSSSNGRSHSFGVRNAASDDASCSVPRTAFSPSQYNGKAHRLRAFVAATSLCMLVACVVFAVRNSSTNAYSRGPALSQSLSAGVPGYWVPSPVPHSKAAAKAVNNKLAAKSGKASQPVSVAAVSGAGRVASHNSQPSLQSRILAKAKSFMQQETNAKDKAFSRVLSQLKPHHTKMMAHFPEDEEAWLHHAASANLKARTDKDKGKLQKIRNLAKRYASEEQSKAYKAAWKRAVAEYKTYDQHKGIAEHVDTAAKQAAAKAVPSKTVKQ